ncbi:hypothetical protein EU537_00540 [Candidatus Thorarchaeota archaeon]|nr:MAG: hypothetical protein EU537_00540 [Candidatus Thorarchaeota archaeon]
MSSLPDRDEYRVKDFVNDLKKINPTPTIMYDIGSNLIYHEVCACKNSVGEGECVTAEMNELLQFMQTDYERDLLAGRLWRTRDTPRAAINKYMRDRPDEFLTHKLQTPNTKVKLILEDAARDRKREKEKLATFEKAVRKMAEESPKDPEVWNRLRLLLWLTGKHNEASAAFRTARKLGWNPETSTLVGI